MATLAVFALCAEPAMGQRAAENALASAEDAFGTSVGNERVGLYNSGSARGFSPIVAGNVRIQGLYFDQQAPLSDRLISGLTMRVGLAAQGYPFPAPTGIADFTLRKSGDGAILSSAVTLNTFGAARLELDGHLRLGEGLSLGGGLSYDLDQLHYGGTPRIVSAAIMPRWRPSGNIEIVPFWSISDFSDVEAQPIAFMAGSFLPPKIERRRLFSPSWTENEFRNVNYGLLATVTSGAWTLRGGLFRSVFDNPFNFLDFTLNTDAQGVGDRFIIAEADRKFGSWSGELRASRLLLEGERRHIVHLTFRGRDQRRRYGGGQTIPAGHIPIDSLPDLDRPQLVFGPQTRDHVRQFTAGVGYQGLWPGVGELSLGIQKTRYRKDGEKPSGPLPVSKDSPWLMNGTVSIHATSKLVFYAGYAKGLEESPIAPTIAVNRDEAPPAIITEQMDTGLRLTLAPNLRLVAGAFEIQKPYFGIDNTNLYRNLGQLRNRGLEMSLAGRVSPRLNVVLGLLLMDPQIRGAAVEAGLVGGRPIDSYKRYISASAEYNLPWIDGLSFDLRFENYGDRTADRKNTFVIPARSVVSAGARYRFEIHDAPSTLRLQWASLTNDYARALFGEGFFYNVPSRLIASLTTDW